MSRMSPQGLALLYSAYRECTSQDIRIDSTAQ